MVSLIDAAREFARDGTVLLGPGAGMVGSCACKVVFLTEAREAVRDDTLLLTSVGGITGGWLFPSDMFGLVYGGVFIKVVRVSFGMVSKT